MNIVLFAHAEVDGPGTLTDFLVSNDTGHHVVRLYQGDPLPDSLESIDGVVSLGGHMNALQDEEYPFLKQETEFLREVMQGGVPSLGICLGAQLTARAAGERVTKMDAMERGCLRVTLTPEGINDPLFRGFPPSPPVFHWHNDTFGLPRGGVLLATSPACRNQAFRLGNSWGVQFHPEVTSAMVRTWCDDDEMNPDESTAIQAAFERMSGKFFPLAQLLWKNFVMLVDEKRKSGA